jgi:hypothetical protein
LIDADATPVSVPPALFNKPADQILALGAELSILTHKRRMCQRIADQKTRPRRQLLLAQLKQRTSSTI